MYKEFFFSGAALERGVVYSARQKNKNNLLQCLLICFLGLFGMNCKNVSNISIYTRSVYILILLIFTAN